MAAERAGQKPAMLPHPALRVHLRAAHLMAVAESHSMTTVAPPLSLWQSKRIRPASQAGKSEVASSCTFRGAVEAWNRHIT